MDLLKKEADSDLWKSDSKYESMGNEMSHFTSSNAFHDMVYHEIIIAF